MTKAARVDTTSHLETEMTHLLEVARHAPSVHNTQPWLVKAQGDTILVHIDKRYILSDGDPTKRETYISLGIFCEALILAAEANGFAIKQARVHDSGATIECSKSPQTANAQTGSAVTMLQKRCTDRSIYMPTAISPDTTKAIKKSAGNFGPNIQVVTDKNIIAQVADATAKGISLALSSPGFRKELSSYLVLPWSGRKRGIAVNSLYIPRLIAYLEPWLLRFGLGLGAEAQLEKRRWLSASAIVVITAKGDSSQYWFAVGRTYLRASLAIEKAGLSQATSAAIVEASNYHEDIEELLGTNERILALLRIGKGSTHRHYSPRLEAAELQQK